MDKQTNTQNLSNNCFNNLPIELKIFIFTFFNAKELYYVRCNSNEWNILGKQAAHPRCALDLKVKYPMITSDKEYTLYFNGDYGKPFEVYCHNMNSINPVEYLTLKVCNKNNNFSCYTAGGSAFGDSVFTHFQKIRINPKSLIVKTDDFTFSTSVGQLEQVYWNGKRKLQFNKIPFATARDCSANNSVISTFIKMGCNPEGSWNFSEDKKIVDLSGGGYCGRVCPALDVTTNEKAKGGDYDNEGINGGWVLQLEWCGT